MKVTKHEHACLDVEQDGKHLIIDPGVFTAPFESYKDVVAVVITDAHGDHLDVEKLKAIYLQNPQAVFCVIQKAADEIGGAVPTAVITNGSKQSCPPFELEFFGTEHARIHASIPAAANSGVMVNGSLYYPGDSFTVPHVPVKMLAVPSSGPWHSIGEAIDFITAIKPTAIFPTHDALYSDIGHMVQNGYLQRAAEGIGAAYHELKPGETLSI